MREDLLGYLLGALEPDEAREVEQRVDADPQWRCEAAFLQSVLGTPGGDSADSFTFLDPPAGLAARTCNRIHELRCSDRQSLAVALVPQT